MLYTVSLTIGNLEWAKTVWLVVCHGHLYAVSSGSCTVWDFKMTTWLLGEGFPFSEISLDGTYMHSCIYIYIYIYMYIGYICI